MHHLQHLLDIKQLSARDIRYLIEKATTFLHGGDPTNKAKNPALRVANLFFEPSTRTSLSFQIAAQRLGIHCLTPNMALSSLAKGETVLDTIHTIAAMGVTVFVVRHHQNDLMAWLARQMPTSCHLINAGEGWLHHPSQALLDLMTIQQQHAEWESLRIAIVGDLRHSRVARSLIDGLQIMGVTDIRLVAPQALKPEEDALQKGQVFTNVEQGITNVDAIVCLRLQKERMCQGQLINENDFYQDYGINTERLKLAKPNAIVLHPGPINRNIEISSEVADGRQSVILRQVKNGVAMRMAILSGLLQTSIQESV